MDDELSEIFVKEDKEDELGMTGEDVILPINVEDSVLFKFYEKIGNFDFEGEKNKAFDILEGKIEMREFEEDLDAIKVRCAQANPSGCKKAWIIFWAFLGMSLAGLFMLVLWIILILDLVILAAELYALKKLKGIVWRWKSSKIDSQWIMKVEEIIVLTNGKYEKLGLTWKFDPESKCIQLMKKKKSDHHLFCSTCTTK